MTDMNMGGSSNDKEQMELDDLLQEWHGDVRDRAQDARMHVLRAARESSGISGTSSVLRTIFMNRYLPFAAMVTLVAMLTVFALPDLTPRATAADGIVMLPDGGRLDAFDRDGNEIGPCSLKNTDVNASASGHFIRVDVDQVFTNSYDVPIEAVYTFPLSHRGAVDRMTMTIRSGNSIRFVEGEIEERGRARQIYEQARDAGYVSSLLEQERPNIFTQSVANIEPGSEITISISYVETLVSTNGTYELVFPTVVGPRYIPGYSTDANTLPRDFVPREGIVLRGPASIDFQEGGFEKGIYHTFKKSEDESSLAEMIRTATAIEKPTTNRDAPVRNPIHAFEATYGNGSREPGMMFDDDTGVIAGRWFCTTPPAPGAPFSDDTDQVPDASKITPMPVPPGTRAGHDISITVEIDTGGIPINEVVSELHEINEISPRAGKGSSGRRVFELARKTAIPNRDFIIKWKLGDDRISESILTHAEAITLPSEEGGDRVDGTIALILNPPDRVESSEVPPRELVFVLDTSGSMNGLPIEKAKAVMTRSIDAMRAEDTFNLITFAGNTHILWDKPRPATEENRKIANAFIESRQGRGGTEMMRAINAALKQGDTYDDVISPLELANLPADGRSVRVVIDMDSYSERKIPVSADVSLDIKTTIAIPESSSTPEDIMLISDTSEVAITGRWITEGGRRFLVVDRASFTGGTQPNVKPMRIVVFMTDGYVGNESAIIDAIKKNADTTRVFSFGIGNSINRYLLDAMARAGRGIAEYVTMESDPDESVRRFARRIQTPVLIDITMRTDGVELVDIMPSGDHLPDLYDEQPIVILARYREAGTTTITLEGRTGEGPWSRTVTVELPAVEPENDVISTLWARAKVDELIHSTNLVAVSDAEGNAIKQQVIALGKEHSIMTPYTSFVAVEKTRVVSDGKPMLVRVPIELPDGTDWNGFFGDPNADPIDIQLEKKILGIPEDMREDIEQIESMDLALGSGAANVSGSANGISPPPPPTSSGVGRSFSSGGFGGVIGAGGRGAVAKRGGSRSSQRYFGARGRGGGGRSRSTEGAALALNTNAEVSFDAKEPDSTVFGSAESVADDQSMTDQMKSADSVLDRTRFERLVRVLDRPLFRLAAHSMLDQADASSIDLKVEKMLIGSDGTILVSIKVDQKEDGIRERLQQSGLEILGSDTTGAFILGRISVDDLVGIGLSDVVLRVVPTTMKTTD